MSGLLANILDNPILTRELRRRMRGKALIYSIISYIILMTISTVFVLLIYSPSPWAEASQKMLQDLQQTGRNIYAWITGIQILLVLIIAPTITAGMTTGEKERKTFDFLRVTTITRWMYIVGCFLSTAFYVGLALLCALPLLSLSFLYGGVALGDVMTAMGYLLGASCVLSAFGLFISSVSERTRTAQGIIVFLIFALLFGGMIVYSQLAIMFAGATQGAAGAATVGMVYVFDFAVPSWLMAAIGMLSLTGVLLLLAARKLFDPDETRAFSHIQFALIGSALMIASVGILNGAPRTNEVPELTFLLLGCAILAIAVQCFAVGRMEVGDEIWHLKRLFPLLRPLDQTVPFLTLVGVGTYIAFESTPGILVTPAAPAGVYHTFALIGVSSFAFFVFAARAFSARTSHRRRASALSGAVIAFFWLVWPLFIAACASVVPSLGSVWRELIVLSPVAIAIDAFQSPAEYAAGSAPGFFGACFYAVLAAGTALYGETLRWKRWRHFDYHYDMPAG